MLFSQTPACLPDEEARLSLPRFVQLASSNAAKLYGLEGRKGTIAPGYDADLIIWHPADTGARVITNDALHHDIDYTPFEGMKVNNWPRLTMLRGKIVWDADAMAAGGRGVVGGKGQGEFLKRGKGQVVVGRTGNVPRGMGQEERAYWL